MGASCLSVGVSPSCCSLEVLGARRPARHQSSWSPFPAPSGSQQPPLRSFYLPQEAGSCPDETPVPSRPWATPAVADEAQLGPACPPHSLGTVSTHHRAQSPHRPDSPTPCFCSGMSPLQMATSFQAPLQCLLPDPPRQRARLCCHLCGVCCGRDDTSRVSIAACISLG